MTSHPDPSVLSAMLRDREREALATSEEVSRLRETAERHARSIDILAAQNTRQGARLASLEKVAGYAQAVVEELADRGVHFADADFLAMALAADAGVSREPSPNFGPEAVAAVHDIDAAQAECKRLRSDLRTLREHVRWYLEVHKDRPGKQNSRQNEHDRECSKMLLWQWVKFGEPTDRIDAPLADDEKLWAVVEAAREVMTARDEVSGGTWGFLVEAEDRLREALARLDGGP